MHGRKDFVTEPARATDAGEVSAVVSVYDVVDSHKHRIMEGEWDDFAEQVNAGEVAPPPILWQHELADPDLNIGYTVKLDPRAKTKDGRSGLGLEAQLDMDHSKAVRAHKLLKSGRVRQWSVYWDGKALYDEESGVPALLGLSAHEFSPVLVGANHFTETQRVKGIALPDDAVAWTDSKGITWVRKDAPQPSPNDQDDPALDRKAEPVGMAMADVSILVAKALHGVAS